MQTKKGQPGRKAENKRRIALGLEPILHESPLKHKHVFERRRKDAELGIDRDVTFQSKLNKLHKYRVSEAWHDMAKRTKDRDGHECKICGKVDMLEVHHLTYCDACHEKPHHLITLCHDCHHAIHYDGDKRRRDWKRLNPKPVLPKENEDE